MNPVTNKTMAFDSRQSTTLTNSIDRVFSEVRRLQRNVFAFWGLGLVMASILPGTAFLASHPGNPGDPQLVLQFWAEAEPARASLRVWLLPMASVVLALMAIPTLTAAPSAEESLDRRAQQVLYSQIQIASALALIVTSWALAPIPVDTPEAIGSLVLCAAVSLLSSGILAVIRVGSDERLRLLDSYTKRRQRIDEELVKLGAAPRFEPAKWWQGVLRDAPLNWHWSTPVAVGLALLPALIVTYGLPTWKSALIILVVSVPATWFLSESISARLKWRWRKPIDPSWHLRLDAASTALTVPTIGAWCASLALSATTGDSWLRYLISIPIALLAFFGLPWLYPVLNAPRTRQLHKRYLQRQRSLTVETIDRQREILRPRNRARRDAPESPAQFRRVARHDSSQRNLGRRHPRRAHRSL